MKDRIKAVRKRFKLSQEEFAARIGLKQQTVTAYECGNREPSNQALTAIVKEFGCNEAWLRTGKGDPFPPKTLEDELNEFLAQIQTDGTDTEAARELIWALKEMGPAFWGQFRDYCVKVHEAHEKGK